MTISFKFVSIFGDVRGKINTSWKDKNGYVGFAQHTHHVAEKFPEIQIHPDVWKVTRPTSSLSPHIFLKAVHILETDQDCEAGTYAKMVSAMRAEFFNLGRNVSDHEVQTKLGHKFGLNMNHIDACLHDGRAHAALMADYKEAQDLGITGSPTLILNQGRQKLYGNVGYRIIDANIQELLREPDPEEASWC